jgi:hypothetical protein
VNLLDGFADAGTIENVSHLFVLSFSVVDTSLLLDVAKEAILLMALLDRVGIFLVPIVIAKTEYCKKASVQKRRRIDVTMFWRY